MPYDNNIMNRRICNQIWTAARRYDFKPLFLARSSDGRSDLYMNIIVGATYKWYGEKFLKDLFGSWEGDHRQSILDDVAWLGIENAIYEKESSERPILQELRMDHAVSFFENENTLMGDKWKHDNPQLYEIQSARWQRVCHHPIRLSSKIICEEKELSFDGSIDADTLSKKIQKLLKKYYGSDIAPVKRMQESHNYKGSIFYHWMKFLRNETPYNNGNILQRSSDSRDHEGKGILQKARFLMKKNRSENDREYIQNTFGISIFSPDVISTIEDKICKGKHFGCHIWYTYGKRPSVRDQNILDTYLNEQYKKNLEEYKKNIEKYTMSIAQLTKHINDTLNIFNDPTPIASRAGILVGNIVWKEVVFGNDKVFYRNYDEDNIGFTVDLFLDASSSRMYNQEVVAVQGYILAESLERCNIPVRVSSFCSLRGYTILKIMKDYKEKKVNYRIFKYLSSGWNRDGLALRALGELLDTDRNTKRIVIMLTDAGPNDDTGIFVKNSFFTKDYNGKQAIADTAEEVYNLRKKGVYIGAVFMGGNENLSAATKIFEKDMVRITDMDQLAKAAGKLIRKQIEKLYTEK